MFDRKAFDPWRRRIAHLLSASVFAFLSLSDHASADIHVPPDSRVIILSGYSSDLMKRELPAINDRVEFLLQGLSEGLEEMFGANVEHLSEKGLNTELEKHGLAKGSPAAVKDFFRIEKYTHLLIADVQMKGERSGSVSMRIFTLAPDGSPIVLGATQKFPLTATKSDSEINTLRQVMLRDFARFRHPGAPKRVTVNCIEPRSLIFDGWTDPLKLERTLIKPVTLQIIEIHQSQKMQSMGYLPVVDRWWWEFEQLDNGKTIKCKRAAPPADGVVSVPNKLPDYVIAGNVGVIDTETGFHKVDLKIQVFRELPTHCETPPILIRHEFMPNSYGRSNLSSDFSEKILPAQYEQQWLVSRDTCSK
jgi:hypothetical protein